MMSNKPIVGDLDLRFRFRIAKCWIQSNGFFSLELPNAENDLSSHGTARVYQALMNFEVFFAEKSIFQHYLSGRLINKSS